MMPSYPIELEEVPSNKGTYFTFHGMRVDILDLPRDATDLKFFEKFRKLDGCWFPRVIAWDDRSFVVILRDQIHPTVAFAEWKKKKGDLGLNNLLDYIPVIQDIMFAVIDLVEVNPKFLIREGQVFIDKYGAQLGFPDFDFENPRGDKYGLMTLFGKKQIASRPELKILLTNFHSHLKRSYVDAPFFIGDQLERLTYFFIGHDSIMFHRMKKEMWERLKDTKKDWVREIRNPYACQSQCDRKIA